MSDDLNIDLTHHFVHAGKWLSMTETKLAAMKADRPDLEAVMRDRFADEADNGIKYFKPHPGDATAAMNDIEHDFVFLLAANQVGKSIGGTAFGIIRIIPCDPDWPIFTENGVKFIKWSGPKKLVVASYSWDNVQVLWEHYMKLLPREELGRYARDWGTRPGERGAPKVVSFGAGTSRPIKLTCGSEIYFICATQQQIHWEGRRVSFFHADEQMPKNMVIATVRGMRTMGKGCQSIFTLTGHRVKGRPDTGGAGWLKRELWEGKATMGRSIGRYRIMLDDVPLHIISAEERAKLNKEEEEAKLNNDLKKLNELKARLHSEWEPGGGLVLDNYDEFVHVIPDFNIPLKRWTLYRGADHGKQKPMAMMLCAMTPRGDMILFKEYYRAGLDVFPNAKACVAACGNERLRTGESPREEDGGVSWDTFTEVFSGMNFMSSVMDARSFNSAAGVGEATIGQLYNDAGYFCTPASAEYFNRKDRDGVLPRMLKWMEIDPQRDHIMKWLHDEKRIDDTTWELWLKDHLGNWKGAPRFYVFSSVRAWRDEARNWTMDEEKDAPGSGQSDHAMDAWKYIVAENPEYRGGEGLGIGIEDMQDEAFQRGYSHI